MVQYTMINKIKYFILLLMIGTSFQLHAGKIFTVTATTETKFFSKRSANIELNHYYQLKVELETLGYFYHEFEVGDLIEIAEEHSIQEMPGKAKFLLDNLTTDRKFNASGEQITSRWAPKEIDPDNVFRVLKIKWDYYEHDYSWLRYCTDTGDRMDIIRTIGKTEPEELWIGDQILKISFNRNTFLVYNLRSGNLSDANICAVIDAILDDDDRIIWIREEISDEFR